MPARQTSFLRSPLVILFSVLVVLAMVAAYFFFRRAVDTTARSARLWTWLRNPISNPEWAVTAGERCDEAPFLLPPNGYIGFLWGDSFRVGHTHQGIDIFGGTPVNETPVVAAYGGYLTRLPDWKSSVIIRIPDDPLYPGRQIWTYYTHLASPQGESYISSQFPPGTSEVFVEPGTFLGYQGNYSGTPGNPTGVHLHFSIVLDDGQGSFRNELEFANTIDPSPYLGLPLNARANQDEIPLCDGKTAFE